MSSTQPGRREAPASAAGVPTEPSVREHASLLRLVANSVPALMAFYDNETLRCLFANAGYAKTFGFDEQSVLGRTLEEIIGPEANRSIEPYVNQIRQTHQPQRYERQLPSPKGRLSTSPSCQSMSTAARRAFSRATSSSSGVKSRPVTRASSSMRQLRGGRSKDSRVPTGAWTSG